MAKLHGQNECFELKGRWSLPGDQNQTAGVLKYNEEELELSLFGGLNKAVVHNPFSYEPEATEFAVVSGTAEDGTPATLYRSFYTSLRPDLNPLDPHPPSHVEFVSSTLHADMLVLGLAAEKGTEGFKRCRIEVPGLENWYRESPYKLDVDYPNNHFCLSFKLPRNEKYDTSNGFKVTLVHTGQPPNLPMSDPEFRYRILIEIEVDVAKDWTWWREIAGDIVGLFSFLYGSPLQSNALLLAMADSNEFHPVYYPRHSQNREPPKSWDMWLTLDKVEKEFGRILSGWLNSSDASKLARRILLSTERRPSSFIEMRFLPLVHAVEVLTQDCENPTYLDPKDYKALVNKVVDGFRDTVPKELVDSIKQSLSYANGRSLKAKTLQLLSGLDEGLLELFCVDKTNFVSGVVNTRNFYTHYGPVKHLLAGEELHWAIEKISTMLRIMLLIDAGVDSATMTKSLRSNILLTQKRNSWRVIPELGTGVPKLLSDG